jgi:hypothetical protein
MGTGSLIALILIVLEIKLVNKHPLTRKRV